MRGLWAVAVAATALPCGMALAQPDSSMRTFGDFVALCGDQAADGGQFCRGYIMGAGQLYQQLVEAGAIKPWACADPVPTLDQARDAIMRWAEANPASATAAPIDGVWQAAAAIWPCSK